MVLDGVTVLFDSATLCLTVGALLVFAGTRRSGDHALSIWGVGYLCGAAGAILFTLRSRVPDFWTLDIANSALILAYGFFLSGARRFAGRQTPAWATIAGAGFWLVACRIPAFHESTTARVIAFSLIVSGYLLATCISLSRVREALPSKMPLVLVLGLHGLFYFARVPGAFFISPQTGPNIVVTPWFLVIAVESLFHLVASSLLLVTMTKERSENGVQRLASTDSLTGLHNRRAFMEVATVRLEDCLRKARPVSVLMIDIDHFKAVNDERGHQAGDEALQAVAATLMQRLRPGDLCGRFGGEEFVCLLTDCDSTQGRDVAERLRAAIQTSTNGLTVSAGVACTKDLPQGVDLQRVLVAADQALYASKNAGRNRVTLARAA